jgi:ABC-type multidrug transport system fused ATPase/permease subunit
MVAIWELFANFSDVDAMLAATIIVEVLRELFMPEGQTKRSALVLLLWGSIATVLIGAVLSFVLAAVYWDRFIAFSNTWGNVVSVAGVWIGFIAFLLTIFSLLITHRAEREARNRIKQALANAADAVTKAQEETREALTEASQAVTAAQAQTREAVARIGIELLQSECAALSHAVQEINRLAVEAASHGEYWVRVAEKCREVSRAANLLLANPHLNEEETSGLRRGADDLNDMASFVERNRIRPGSAQSPLRAEQAKPLQAMFSLITTISTRLRRRVLEVPNANI